MSSAQAGSLQASPFPDVLGGLVRERRTGVLRVRASGPDGAQRGEIVLGEGRLIGAAVYRAGGLTGTGDALVEAALCSPEDAAAAFEYAAQTAAWAPGTLAEGAARAGVSLEHVVKVLVAHIEWVLGTVMEWRAGSWEFLLEGLPASAEDRDSAAARAFLLDEGVPPSELSLPAELSSTLEQKAAEVERAREDDPDVTRRSRAAAPSPVFRMTASAPPEALGPPPELGEPGGTLGEESGPGRAPAPGASPPLGEEELFADADTSQPDAPGDEGEAGGAELGTDPATEVTHAEVEPGDVDWSAPGGAEAALMEAETLLDSEVLSVMLEMGNSAAATASGASSPERILTGHLLLVDEEGQLAGALGMPLREAGYAVHLFRGLAAGCAALERAASEKQRPLLIVDLLLDRGGEGGMTGGLDLLDRANELAIPALLLGEAGPEVQARALASGAAAVLSRPLRNELKQEGVRLAFVESVLEAIDEHRPRAGWVTPDEIPGSLEEGAEIPFEEPGWDVGEIEKKAEQVDDLPDFAMMDPAARMESLWRETTAALAAGMSRPEILLQVLRFGAEVLARAVLFTPAAKGDELVGFGQFGIELAPDVDADEAVRGIRLPARGHPAIARAVEARQPIKGRSGESEWEDRLAKALGGIRPEEIFVAPVFCRGRLAALLYGDMLPGKEPLPDTTNLEIVVGQAGLALDRAELEARLAALERKD